LTYLRARWYHPGQGTLLGRDPFEGWSGKPYSQQYYQYAYNNPILYTDPSGRDPWWYEDPHPETTVTPASGQVEIDNRNRRCHERDYLATLSGDDPGPCGTNILVEHPHEVLDALGTVEVLGAPADLLNAALYCVEGNFGDAAWAASSALPLVGLGATIGKWARKLKNVDEAYAVYGLVRKIADTKGLQHSFDRHAWEWFGVHRKTLNNEYYARWQALIEQAAQSKKVFDWSVRNTPTIAHLARLDGKYLVVQFWKTGPLAGELATAFHPRPHQLKEMLRRLKR
jgi:hypothetical protein